MTRKDLDKVNEWKDSKRNEILDSGTIAGMIAYQLNKVLSDPSSTDRGKAMFLAYTRNLGYVISKNERGTFDITKLVVKNNMNWEVA